ncbi:MAG: sugar transferase [Acidimicrobiales bacterium]|jgi:exopolysaccharide biosynthesis polyprenyl glycosylphosphotransferase
MSQPIMGGAQRSDISLDGDAQRSDVALDLTAAGIPGWVPVAATVAPVTEPSPAVPEPPTVGARELTLSETSSSAVSWGKARRARSWLYLLLLADVASLAESFIFGAALRQPFGPAEGPSLSASVTRELPYLPLYILAMALYGLYQRDQRRLRTTSFLDIGRRSHALAVGAVGSLAVSAGLARLFGWPKLGWVEVVLMSLPATALMPLARAGVGQVMRHQGTLRSRVVIVGSGTVASSLAHRLKSCPDIELVGYVDDAPLLLPAGHLGTPLGAITDLPRICAQTGVDRVLVAFSRSSPSWVVEMLRRLPANVRISVVPRLFELVTWQSHIEELHGLTVMDVAPPSLGPISRATKRSLDIVVSSATLLALVPFMVVTAIAIKVTSPGPVFFRQERIGYKGRTFRIIKFRTMQDGADEIKIDLRDHNEVDGPLFKLHHDPRATSVGRLLRPYSLDEVPQLFNVLAGNMSLVGPRPFVPDESAGIDGWAARRFEVRPGMTGLWQVSGRSDLPFEELRQLDYAYVASWSLWWDIKILWHTPGTVFGRLGAY